MVPHIIKIVILSYYFQCYLKLILLWLYLIAISWITSHLGNQRTESTESHSFMMHLTSSYQVPTEYVPSYSRSDLVINKELTFFWGGSVL